MIKVKLGRGFDQQYKNIILNDLKLREIVLDKQELFKNNPEDTRLQNHALIKRLHGKFAFSITGDIRIVYVWIGKNTVRFLAIGTHFQVYGK